MLDKIKEEDGQEIFCKIISIDAHQGHLNVLLLITRYFVGIFMYYGEMGRSHRNLYP